MASAFETLIAAELPKRSALDTVVTVSYDGDPNDPSAPAALKGSPLGSWFREDTAAKWWRKTGNGATDWEEQGGGGGGAVAQTRTLYVGKHGSDANEGTDVDLAKLTIGSAVTAATALTPTVGAPVVVRIIDAGIYDEAVVLPAYVHLDGPRAEITRNSAGVDTVTAGTGCVVRLRRASCAGVNGFAVTSAAAATGPVYFDVVEIVGTSSGQPIANRGAGATTVVSASWAQTSNRGVFEDKSGGPVVLDIDNMVMAASSTFGILIGSGASVTGRVGSIRKSSGGLTGTFGISNGIPTTLVCGEIDADTAVQADFGNTVNVIVGRLSGAIAGAGTANVLRADVSASGDVTGPGSSTDNALARYDLTTGKLIQNSSVTVSDAGEMVFPAAGSITKPGAFILSEVFGAGASVTGPRGTAFGASATAADSGSAFGPNARATGIGSSAYGRDALASGGNALAFGFGVTASATGAIAAGNSTAVSQPQGTGFGRNVNVSAIGGTAYGYQTVVSHSGSAAIGRFAASTAADRCTIGTIGGSYDLELQNGKGLGVFGATPPSSQPAKIADPTDLASCITAIGAIIDVLEGAGLASST